LLKLVNEIPNRTSHVTQSTALTQLIGPEEFKSGSASGSGNDSILIHQQQQLSRVSNPFAVA
jgi:hypothetical protein